jgi:AraC-like DNA-binding protein
MAPRDTNLTESDNRTLLGSWVRGLLGAVAARGLDANQLLEAVGMSSADLIDIDARVPHGAVCDLLDEAVRRSSDPALGIHFAESLDLDSIGVLGYAVRSSRTLRDVFDRCVRYNRLIDSGSLGFELEGPRVVVRFRRGARICRPLADASVAAVVTFARRVAGEAGTPLSVTFTYPRPDDLAEHQRFFRCPVEFGCVATDVAFDATILDLPAERPDELLARHLDRHAETLLAALPPDGELRARLRNVLTKSLLAGGNVSAESAAAELGTTARTLHRRLSAEGVSYRDVFDDTRYVLAQRLLRERTSPIEEVAYVLGFSEVSAFSRAFKRWAGTSPGAFRRQG